MIFTDEASALDHLETLDPAGSPVVVPLPTMEDVRWLLQAAAAQFEQVLVDYYHKTKKGVAFPILPQLEQLKGQQS